MMNKTFAGLLEYYVVTYAIKEAGLSKQTLRSYYSSIEQYILWIRENEEVTVADIDR
jgi:site-specific recombinase XerD